MTEHYIDEDVRTRLILAGMSELEKYGVRDFSLRRCAEIAGVSCAAPYRYFKSKEVFISAIYSCLSEKWELLFLEIERAYPHDKKMFVTEAVIANIRFWLANKNLRSAILVSDFSSDGIKLSDFDSRILSEAEAYLKSRDVPTELINEKINSLRALLYGYVTLIGAGALENSEQVFSLVRRNVAMTLDTAG